MKDSKQIPVRLIATTPEGDIPVRGEYGAIPLPIGPLDTSRESDLRYGPYLEAVRSVVMRNNCQKILEALARRLDRAVDLEEIRWLEIRTEKHGAYYHVARADLNVAGNILSFAINVAASKEAKSRLEKDFRLLIKLERKYRHPYLARAYFKSAGRYREEGRTLRWLHAFVAEWYRGYHEFHLHWDPSKDVYGLLLWDLDRGSRSLSTVQELELYRQAARILTLYYDWNSFRQIYPWHHAAGDFVVKEQEGRVDLRLVTVRDYVPVVDFKSRKRAGKLLALVLFFLHLTVQMRLDRLDGVGDVVWAEDYCLKGVVGGFFEGLARGDERSRKGMPSVSEVRAVLQHFTKDEWLQLLVELLATYTFSQEEASHIRDQGEAHIGCLQQVLATCR